jgi:hypothetical protein
MTTPHRPPGEEPGAGARPLVAEARLPDASARLPGAGARPPVAEACPPGAAPGLRTARRRVAAGASFVGVTASRRRRRVLRGRDPATGGRRRVRDGH